MIKKAKGFTLIELLAVIAILAIILLIAVPKVLSTVATSKTNTAKASGQLIWKTAESCIALNIMDSNACNAPGTGTPSGYGSAGGTAYPILDNLSDFSGTYTVTVVSNAVTKVEVTPTGGTLCTINSANDTDCAA